MIFPDPRSIKGPAMFPMRRPAQATSRSGGLRTPVHSHRAYPDRNGNGNTELAAGHFHAIVGGQVLPAVDGHTHILTDVPNGAGI
jgi:hypothetical protein